MEYQRTSGHTVSRLIAHIVRATKYRYKVLEVDKNLRCRKIIRQICESEDVEILKGVVSSDHIHIHINYLPSLNLSNLVKKLKGRTSRKLQQEFPELKK
jgi:putative transposase